MYCFVFLQSFLTAVIDVVRVAVLLLLLLVRVTTGHDEVTGPGDVSSLCGQEVKQQYNNKLQHNNQPSVHLYLQLHQVFLLAINTECILALGVIRTPQSCKIKRCVLYLLCPSALPVLGVFVMSTAPRSFLSRSSCCCCCFLL